jgi:group II intron reverse transcriptase/maturase
MSTKLLSITHRARRNPKERFTSLMHLLTVDFLRDCFMELKRNKAPGVDGITVRQYEDNVEERLADLVVRLKSWRYRPQPVRRVYIPKPKGGRRPLGIPSVEDKIVQMALKRTLEAIFEGDFADVSFGFRPKRDCHQALDILDKVVMTRPVSYIVDVDIEKFFDTVDHKWLMKFLAHRVSDPNFLRLVGRFLRAGVFEEGKYYRIEKGTPQGGILSPLLANIYLHYVLDLWFEKVEKKRATGFSQLIRYADDFVVCFQKGAEAKAFEERLEDRLNKFGLAISEEKRQTIEFGRHPWLKARDEGRKLSTFDFLGFTHYCDRTRKGKFKLGRRTSSAKYRQKVKELNLWLKSVRSTVELREWWEGLRVRLLGHYRYYGVSGNMYKLGAFYNWVLKLAYRWINRRSQKRSYSWDQFHAHLRHHLPYHLDEDVLLKSRMRESLTYGSVRGTQ